MEKEMQKLFDELLTLQPRAETPPAWLNEKHGGKPVSWFCPFCGVELPDHPIFAYPCEACEKR